MCANLLPKLWFDYDSDTQNKLLNARVESRLWRDHQQWMRSYEESLLPYDSFIMKEFMEQDIIAEMMRKLKWCHEAGIQVFEVMPTVNSLEVSMQGPQYHIREDDMYRLIFIDNQVNDQTVQEAIEFAKNRLADFIDRL